jgi:hypothetical protein
MNIEDYKSLKYPVITTELMRQKFVEEPDFDSCYMCFKTLLKFKLRDFILHRIRNGLSKSYKNFSFHKMDIEFLLDEIIFKEGNSPHYSKCLIENWQAISCADVILEQNKDYELNYVRNSSHNIFQHLINLSITEELFLLLNNGYKYEIKDDTYFINLV